MKRSIHTVNIVVDSSGEVDFLGHANGPMRVHQESRNTVVIHEAGHKYWASIGTQNYAPARFHVFTIIEKTPMGWVADEVAEFPIRSE